jgi:putative endonuclease
MDQKKYAVYILASSRNGTLYIGVTNNLARRINEHRSGEGGEFTKKYRVHQLMYYEFFHDVKDALRREKQLKNWKRKWKLALIEKENPDWRDLFSLL